MPVGLALCTKKNTRPKLTGLYLREETDNAPKLPEPRRELPLEPPRPCSVCMLGWCWFRRVHLLYSSCIGTVTFLHLNGLGRRRVVFTRRRRLRLACVRYTSLLHNSVVDLQPLITTAATLNQDRSLSAVRDCERPVGPRIGRAMALG